MRQRISPDGWPGRSAHGGNPSWLRWTGAAALVLATFVLSPSSALAQESEEAAGSEPSPAEVLTEEEEREFREQIRVYQQKPFMRKLRATVTPLFGLSVNETLLWQYSVGGMVRFYVTDELGFGGSYRKYFHSEKDAWDEVETDLAVFPELKYRDFYAGGHVIYTPLYGKFILFDSAIVHFDASLIAGAGVMRTYTRGLDGDNNVSWNVGFGARMAVTEWLSFDFELRDYMYIEPYKAGDTFVNDVVLQFGLSVFIPFEYDYEYPK